jgi:putative ABC transport system permease protein
MGKLIWRNLTRNKLRTLLTLGSVGMALFVLGLLGSFLNAMEGAEGAADNRIVVRHAVSLTFAMPESYETKLRELDHVVEVTPLNWYQGSYIDDRPENFFPRFSSDPNTLFTVFSDLTIPEDHLAAWKEDRAGFVAGKALVDKYGWKIGDQISIKGDIYPVDVQLNLRGIFEAPTARAGERQIFFQRRYLEEAMNNPGQVGTYWLKLDGPSSVAGVVKAAEALYENSDAPVRGETEEAFQLSFLEMMGNVRLLLGSIGLAIVISILFITANTMAMAARDRTREVAVLRTLGFRANQVIGLVLSESLLVSVLGAVAGVGFLALVLGATREGLEEGFAIFGMLKVSPELWGQALGIGVVIGLLSGIFPALAAARSNIVDGLRKVA